MTAEGVYLLLLLVTPCGGIVGTKGDFQSWCIGQEDREES